MLKKSVENAPVVASDYVQESKINVTKCQDTQIGNRYYYNVEKINVVCSDAEKEITLDPALLTNNISSPLKTDNSSKVIVINNQKFQIQRRYVLAVAAVLVLITVTVTLAVILTTASSGNNNDDPGNGTLKIVGRAEWFAQPPTEEISQLPGSPAPFLIVFDTMGSPCFKTPTCCNVVKSIQSEHIARIYGDIAYQFLIGGDGAAYVGRGWDLVGGHTLELDGCSIAINFIGDFFQILPLEKQIKAFWELVKIGVDNNKLMKNYTLITYRDVRSGSWCPGKKFYDLITTWPHYRKYEPKRDLEICHRSESKIK